MWGPISSLPRLRLRGRIAASSLLALAPIGAFAQVIQGPSGEPLSLAAPVRPVKEETAIYLVQLKDPAVANYRGAKQGFAATKPGAGKRIDAGSGAVESYAKHLEQRHDQLLNEIGAADSKVYSFRYVLNGFAARLTAAQVSQLAQRDDVERVWRDTSRRVQTNNSSGFLGLQDTSGGLRAALGLRGENVVIGVIDSGVAPGHPSLSDSVAHVPRTCMSHWARASWLGRWLCHSVRRDPPTSLVYDPPESFRGVCQTGEGFSAEHCNNKLIGARFYIDGFLAQHELDPGEFLSPKDAQGHGTHVATIAAGNSSVPAYLFGTRVARVSGIAPRARVAVYKACWLEPGAASATCATSDLARAIDDAVADGVDIINYSVGTTLQETDLTAPDDRALLNALDAGVLTVVAAGNEGPDLGTIGSPSSAPWVMTVAASTQSGVVFDDAIAITAPPEIQGPLVMREASFTPQLIGLEPIEETLILADDDQSTIGAGATGSERDACEPLTNAAELQGRIALIERGSCEFQLKLQHAEQAGAVGAVVYNTNGPPIVMNGDVGSVDIPAVMIGASDAEELVDRLVDGEEIVIELGRGIFIEQSVSGNEMAEFSARGPSLSDADFLKPDVTAPGVNILAGHTPDVASGLRGERFRYVSGTSQAAPHVAGAAALLKEAHPDWSPSALKSALMTTARRNIVRDGGEANADALDMGAGHIDPNLAVDPGLVYDAGTADYAAYLCGLINTPFTDDECRELANAGYPFAARDVNLPSISVAEFVTGDVVTRLVTNVGAPASFAASVSAPPNIDIFVEPQTLALATGQTAQFSMQLVSRDAFFDEWHFGELTWSDGTRSVTSPIAILPAALRAPPSIFLTGTSGTVSLPVAFGYEGDYLAQVHGLRPPQSIQPGFVEDDLTNTFTFRTNNGVRVHEIPTVTPDQLYLRVALFDDLTDGADDLDLFLFHCPSNLCSQVGQSGTFTSQEEINLVRPPPGRYVALVHGFETDEVSGGPGANYTLFNWAFSLNDDVGNLTIDAPQTVLEAERLEFELEWSGLEPGARYLGAISHSTPLGIYSLTIVNVDTL